MTNRSSSSSSPTPSEPVAPSSWDDLSATLGLAITVFEPPAKPSKKETASAEDAPVLHYSDGPRGIRLYRGDALQMLKQTRGEMFDCIFADPPYFLSNDGITCQNGKMVSVNKGAWDKAQTFEQIHAFNLEWLQECKRILKPNGTIWVSGTNHNIYSVGFALQTLEFKVLNDIAWYKVNPPPNLACRYFTHATETILWARREPKGKHAFHYEDMKRDNGGKQMQSLWSITPPAPREKRYGKHPTQKPEALLDRIIRSSTSPGDIVLDPFCGSGTTGVVCSRHGRRFVGFDIDENYLKLAAQRIQSEMHQGHFIFSLSMSVHERVIEKPVDITGTWADTVRLALCQLGGTGHLREINQLLEGNPRTTKNPTWPCTVRRVVRQSALFTPLGRGNYSLRNSEKSI